MNKLNLSHLKPYWNSFIGSVFPTRRDNITQIVLKALFFIGLIALIVFFGLTAGYFGKVNAEQVILTENKQILAQYMASSNDGTENTLKHFKKENKDIKGWITIKNTDLSAPVYQASDNTFYKNHNQLKKKSALGSLFFDCKDEITKNTIDNNLIIYGKNESQLFSCLEKYKSMYYYSKNPFIELSTFHSKDAYVIFAAFVINSDKKDDGGYIFNYKKSNFKNSDDFDNWYNELCQRSIYLTDIPVTLDDEFLTLVTDTEDFKGAKLVLTARKLKEKENIYEHSVYINKKPRYPEIYYKTKGINNPFNTKEENYVS